MYSKWPNCPSKWPCLSLKMALPVPQNGPAYPSKWPQCQCGNFFYIKKGFYYDSFFRVFYKCLNTFVIHVHTCFDF